MVIPMKRNILALGLLTLAGLTLSAQNASAWLLDCLCEHHMQKYSLYIVCRPYNAFTPVCYGNINCLGGCPAPCAPSCFQGDSCDTGCAGGSCTAGLPQIISNNMAYGTLPVNPNMVPVQGYTGQAFYGPQLQTNMLPQLPQMQMQPVQALPQQMQGTPQPMQNMPMPLVNPVNYNYYPVNYGYPTVPAQVPAYWYGAGN